MGGCLSRPSGHSAPDAQPHNPPTPSARSSSIRSSHASQRDDPGPWDRSNTNELPNSPLQSISPVQRSRLPYPLASPAARSGEGVKPPTNSTNALWTRPQLHKERQDWWETQVTGSQQAWGAIRLAAQYLQANELQEAQTILDAAGCTCPSGLLWRGVYDVTGVRYNVPEWLVIEPDGLVDEQDTLAAVAFMPTNDGAQGSAQLQEDQQDQVKLVRARISHNQQDVVISIQRKEDIVSIIEKIKQQSKTDESSKVRLVYSGRLYQDSETLEAHPHWDYAKEHVLSALVTA